MSVNKIHYDYEQCSRCVENLHALQEKLHVQKQELSGLQSRGVLMEEVWGLADAYEQLENSFDLLVGNTAAFITAAVSGIQAVDEAAAEERM